jgi:hypothetical protein
MRTQGGPQARLLMLATPVALRELNSPTGLAGSFRGASQHNDGVAGASEVRQDGIDPTRHNPRHKRLNVAQYDHDSSAPQR